MRPALNDTRPRLVPDCPVADTALVENCFHLPDNERDDLITRLLSIAGHPYRNYWAFRSAITQTFAGNPPHYLMDFVQTLRASDPAATPYLAARNCPIDPDLPMLDWNDPVADKHRRKTTFVAEGFLTLMSCLLGWPAFAHRSVNDGDFFHDIAAKRSMTASQSQKTLDTLRFHMDFTNHFARPDHVLQLTLRNAPQNKVYSTFVANRSVIRNLPAHTASLLRQPLYLTPYDDITLQNKGLRLAVPARHAVIEGDCHLRLFEGRTHGLNDAAQQALTDVLAVIHAHKHAVQPRPGDFILIHNRYALHGKEIVDISDPAAHRHRWLMKTHNATSLTGLESFFEATHYGVVNG